ncbi:MAG: hypothetical protein NC341_05810 [Blautia sp.]|nr:hypothetical protein [Blautia sp.]MCM1199992.1 hypothetical protein [Bacteroides fragilis]
MSKTTQNYEQLAAALGFKFDRERNVLYGLREGFDLLVYAADARYPYCFTVTVSARSPMGPLTKEDNKLFSKNEKPVVSLVQEGNLIRMTLKNVKKQEQLRENLNKGIGALTAFLRSRGFAPCCQLCGQQMETAGYETKGGYMHLCPDCAGRMRQDVAMAAQQKKRKNENLVGGIVGALLGSVIGAVCIIFFSQLGRVAVLSGIVMAVCTMKGYELLSGRLTKKGIVISVVMMLAMTYIGDRMDWAILVAGEWDVDLFTGFRYVPVLLAEGIIESANYWGNLALLYVFTVGGAIPTVMSIVKERKSEGEFAQIGSPKM